MAKQGEAYGFFYYSGSTESLAERMPEMRKKAHTPGSMNVTLLDKFDNLDKDDPALTEIIEKANNSHMSHVVKAVMPDKGNRYVAMEVGDILSQIYRNFYAKNEPFCAGVVYKRGNQYVFRDE